MPKSRHNWTVDLANYPELERLLEGVQLVTRKERASILVQALLKWADVEFPSVKRERFFAQIEALRQVARESGTESESTTGPVLFTDRGTAPTQQADSDNHSINLASRRERKAA